MTVAQSTGAVSDRTCMVHRLQVRSVKVVQFLNCRVLCRAFERLERHESKGSRAVLRGLEGSNALRLPDPAQVSDLTRVRTAVRGWYHFSIEDLLLSKLDISIGKK
jgi:hypothetical protein